MCTHIIYSALVRACPQEGSDSGPRPTTGNHRVPATTTTTPLPPCLQRDVDAAQRQRHGVWMPSLLSASALSIVRSSRLRT